MAIRPIVLLTLAAGAAAVFCMRHAAAHHSITAEYDTARTVTITGVISNVTLINPHVWIEVKSDGGGETTAVEMGAPNALTRRGVDPRTLLTVGRKVVVEGFPALNRNGDAQGPRLSGRVLVTDDGVRHDVSDAFGWTLIVPRPPPTVD